MKLTSQSARRRHALVLLALAVLAWLAFGVLIWTGSDPAHQNARTAAFVVIGAVGFTGAVLGFWRFAIKKEPVPKSVTEMKEYLGLGRSKE